jgi:hypothetical protein
MSLLELQNLLKSLERLNLSARRPLVWAAGLADLSPLAAAKLPQASSV